MSAAAMSAAVVNPLDMTGGHVLVTGASSGIGRATAVLLSRLGARVTATGRDPARLDGTAAILHGGGHAAVPFDLSEIDAIPGWLRGLAADRGGFSGIAHCAGIQISKPVRMVDAAFMDFNFRVNVSSGLALARGLRQKGCAGPQGAALVLIASAAAFAGSPSNVVYSAAKGAVVSATKALAVELARDGIRVNCICPGLVETEMVEKFKAVLTPEQYAARVAAYPLGVGQPEDVAAAAAYLLAGTGRWITGISLLLDGGALAGG